MTLKFGTLTKQGVYQFLPDIPLAFKGENVEEYFEACGWAAPTKEKPVHTYEADEVTVDLDTVHNEHRAPIRLLIKHKGDGEKARASWNEERQKEQAKLDKEASLKPHDVVSSSGVGG